MPVISYELTVISGSGANSRPAWIHDPPCLFFLSLSFLKVFEAVSLYISACPGFHYIDQVDFKLTEDPPAFLSQGYAPPCIANMHILLLLCLNLNVVAGHPVGAWWHGEPYGPLL